jgi:hypothetical protein
MYYNKYTTEKEISLIQLNKEVEELKAKNEILLKRMDTMINERISIRLSNEGFMLYLTQTTKEFIKINLEGFVNKIVTETINTTLKKLNKKIDYDYKITKELCQSIDEEIKHTIRKLDTSAHTDNIIKEEFKKHLENISNNRNITLKGLEQCKSN